MEQREWNWLSQEGNQVHAVEWRPNNEATTHAVIILVHGKGEHAGGYIHVAENFTASGIAVMAFDQFGHGKTEGKRGDAPSYDHLMEGIDRLLEEAKHRYAGLPVFLYGHSMGGNIVINYALRRRQPLAGAIASSPWLKLSAAEQPVFLKIANRILQQRKSKLSIGPPSYLTSDAEMLAKITSDPLRHNRFSARLFFAIRRAGQWALANADSLSVPMLIMHGDRDTVTSFEASRLFAERAGTRCTFREWPGLKHELHNEKEREQIFAAVKTWIRERTDEWIGERSGE